MTKEKESKSIITRQNQTADTTNKVYICTVKKLNNICKFHSNKLRLRANMLTNRAKTNYMFFSLDSSTRTAFYPSVHGSIYQSQ